MICSGDSEWEARETCEVGELCDSVNDATAGACRALLPECESGSDEPFCSDAGVEVCNPGGFDTEVLDMCLPNEICLTTGCVPEPDDCPPMDAFGCAADACDLFTSQCAANSTCDVGLQLFIDAVPEIVRLPERMPCATNFPGCPAGESFQVGINEDDVEDWIRVTMDPGWEMRPNYDDDSDDTGCRAPVEGCLILEPADGTPNPGLPERSVNFYPLMDPPISRNVLFEIVPDGTTCD